MTMAVNLKLTRGEFTLEQTHSALHDYRIDTRPFIGRGIFASQEVDRSIVLHANRARENRRHQTARQER